MTNYCVGLFCSAEKTDIQCYKCGIFICKTCNTRINNKNYCIDCLISLGYKYYIDDIEKALNKFGETLFPDKNIIK